MELPPDIKSWLWIPLSWVIVYASLLLVGVTLGLVVGESYYWGAFLVGVPLFIIPLTYRNLVGGGCSLRFQICALVKGMLAGLVFMILASAADFIVWNMLGVYAGWSPLSDMRTTSFMYQIWFFSGAIGGMGARIAEVRGYSKHTEGAITVAGFE